MKKLSSLLLALMATITIANAEIINGTCGDNLTWSLNTEDSTLTISGAGAMTFAPWTANNYKLAIKTAIIEDGVTSVCRAAFMYCTNLKSATIGNSVTQIENYAFFECNGLSYIILGNNVICLGQEAFGGCCGLTAISLPNSLTTIEDWAFSNCRVLTSVTIPQNVASIGQAAFGGCFSLTEINVVSENTNFCSVDGVVFNKAMTTLVQYPGGVQGDYIIPNSVTAVAAGAFWNCPNLTGIKIPSGVTSLGERGFSACKGLTSIICEAVTPSTCGTEEFYSVDKSIPLYVPAESIELYKAADQWKDFTNIQAIPAAGPCIVASGTCGAEGDNLTWEISCDSVLTISGTGEMKDFTNPDDSPWRLYFYKFKSAVINEGVTSIGDYAFSLCTILTSIEIPNSVTRIGSQAFADCSDLTSVVIPNGVSEIREGTFARCSGLISVTLPNGVLSIGLGSFTECSHLTSFEIPNSVTEIGENAFHGCSSLTSITIPNNVTSIGDYAFQGCSGLTSLTVGKELTSMGSTAFEGCNNLTYVNITDLAAWCKINFRSYGACNPLYLSQKLYLNGELVTDLVIPDGATSISDRAFYGCSGLTSVSIPNSVTSIGDYVFYQCSGLTSVTIPNSVIEIGEYAFYGCTNLPVIDNIRYADAYLASVADKSLSAYSIKDGTKWIGTRAFSDCASLTSIEIPNSVTTLGEEAFSGCMSLTSVSIPNSVTRIGEIAFGMCSNLTSITIPNSVTSIGSVAFDACTSLTSITCEALAPPTLGNRVFKKVDTTIPLYVPAESIELYKAADQWKDFTNILPIEGFPVIFLDYNSNVLSNQQVKYGMAAEAPQVPAREGYTFMGWNVDIEHIVAMTYAIALYDKIGGTVTYLSEEGDEIATENVDLHLPAAPIIAGKSFKGWLTESADADGIVLRATYTSDNPTTHDDVTVTPSCTSADVSFPFITGALTYELVIRDLSGNVVCKIMFNANGQLLGIAFAPSRNRNQQATQSTGFNFTVEGLNANTTYSYEFVAHDEKDDVIETLSGLFTTTADAPTGNEIVKHQSANRKYIESGHLFIDNNDRTFDARGQQVR